MILCIGLMLIPFPFICHYVWMFICDIAVILIYYCDYIACSGHFRLSAYAGAFSLRIYVADSHHDSVFTYLRSGAWQHWRFKKHLFKQEKENLNWIWLEVGTSTDLWFHVVLFTSVDLWTDMNQKNGDNFESKTSIYWVCDYSKKI